MDSNGGSGRIEWEQIFRVLRGEKYRFTKDEILDLTMWELSVYLVEDEAIDRKFEGKDGQVRAEKFAQVNRERDELFVRMLTDGA